ncbi:putative protein OS=Tsukamurella paurometabola (strain ATCC 8368 / DSM / CCUG 35730 /CIP 100753 / JCM 10117 / KCTC 9821 / NBRC 16120 / NCIMB 702349/ NCTC 13040) OX=521096 GN=Tpau_0291 PE=4 SV=1 [Tsukamurella paurometabola]|uniref:Uncharacterized protein n=1 Tax=Tsukamurella paurometabola (strain ATCC 8368 / DSM 20162 / CCUG 35730 / CIP 100753 / JCM 10117 / KCTC 9821 / NBRC 16120 / NCIMB 702349 / NCTC 13040) TaxID=521096 RepID=D5UQV5_TSUPD|nr:hypothetical protein [Tsukamurella paurometabola]ADG76938.1 hypothetical protein Tpau_0291 [Tsukamurella paurometabola DSM 20162]SUP42271.1 Uncharacterised protein [Tsukamurella paurometabola]
MKRSLSGVVLIFLGIALLAFGVVALGFQNSVAGWAFVAVGVMTIMLGAAALLSIRYGADRHVDKDRGELDPILGDGATSSAEERKFAERYRENSHEAGGRHRARGV